MKRRITIDIDYSLNGTPPEKIDDLLDHAMRLLAGEGLLSGETTAEVDTWHYEIKDPTLPSMQEVIKEANYE